MQWVRCDPVTEKVVNSNQTPAVKQAVIEAKSKNLVDKTAELEATGSVTIGHPQLFASECGAVEDFGGGAGMIGRLEGT